MSNSRSGTSKRRNVVQEKSYAFASIHDDCEERHKLRYPIVKSAKQNVGPPYSSFFITHSPLNPCCATT